MVDVELVDVPSQTVVMVRRVVPMQDLPAFFGEAFERVARAVPEAGSAICGPPFGWYHGMPGETVDVAAGFPVSGDGHAPDGHAPDGGVEVVERPGGRALVAVHVGAYDSLERTWGELQRRAETDALERREDCWEEYLSEAAGDPSTWRTRVVMPVS